jgi:hypothetical protein
MGGWFSALDAVGAAKLDHRRIAQHLAKAYGVPLYRATASAASRSRWFPEGE